MCLYCHYLGQGKDWDAKIVDVEIHEETCSEKPIDECDKCGNPEIYKQWDNTKLCQICYEDLEADAKSVAEDLKEQD